MVAVVWSWSDPILHITYSLISSPPPPRSPATRWRDTIKLLSAHVEKEMCSYPGPSTRPSYSSRPSGSALNLEKVECSTCMLLANKIKTLDAKIKILEGTLGMKRHHENHTLESAAILYELFNDMGKLAYDPSAKAEYVDAVNAFGTVNFSLLFELRSKKDASVVDLMDSLRLEGTLAEIPGAKDLQPSSEQLMLPLHRPKDNVVLGEISISFSLYVVHSRVQRSLIGKASTSATPITTEPITTLSTTFTSSDVVPPLSISTDQILDTEPNDADPPVVTFYKKELATSPE
nr:hypothetical protein [Tanacetum cinerariifolium]